MSAASIPLAGATATMYMNGNATSVHTTLAEDGSFSLSVKPGWSADWYVTIDSAEPWPHSLHLGGDIVANTRITVLRVFQTRVQTLAVPGRARGSLVVQNRGHGPGQGRLDVEGRPVGRGRLLRPLPAQRQVGAGLAAARPTAAARLAGRRAQAKRGHLAWQARVNAQRIGTTVYRESASASRDSFFVDRTYVNEMVALHLHGGTDLGAIVDDDPVADGVADAVSGVAKFYYRGQGLKDLALPRFRSDRQRRRGGNFPQRHRRRLLPHRLSGKAGRFPRLKRHKVLELNYRRLPCVPG